MYELSRYNPRLGGCIYRTHRKCGDLNCKCSSTSYRHFFYRLEYRVKENGHWKKKREYVPKNKVKAFRQRIRRAKEKDIRRRQEIKLFIQQASELINGNGYTDIFKLKLLLDQNQDKLKPVTLSQQTQLIKCLVSLIVKLSL